MPERQAGHDNLRIGAHVASWLLTCWAAALCVLSLATHTVVGDALHRFGAPLWLMPAALFTLAALQVHGHLTQSARALVRADMAGSAMCMTAACVAAYAALNGDNASVSAANWAVIGGLFLVHASVLKAE